MQRTTSETEIELSLLIDGEGAATVSTGIGFLDHMLELFAHHGRFDLDVRARGDLDVDGHHTVEDIGLALGQAFAEALGERRGIRRYGSFLLPMDEALVLVALDLSGRPHLEHDLRPRRVCAWARSMPISRATSGARSSTRRASLCTYAC